MRRYIEIKVGILVSLGLALFIAVVFFLRPLGWFQRGVQFTMLVNSAHGLRSGSEVYVQGVKVGTVRDVSFRPDGKVAVKAVVHPDAPIYKGSRFAIRIHPLLGQAYVSVDTPKRARKLVRLRSDATVNGIEPVELDELMPRAQKLIEHLGGLASSFEELIGDKAFQASIRNVARELSETASNLRKLTGDAKLIEAIKQTAMHIEGTTRQLEMLVRDQRLRKSIGMTAENLSEATGALRRLLSDRRLQEGLPKLISNLECASGELRSLLSDKELRGTLAKAIANIEAASRQLNELLSDKELREGLHTSVVNIGEASKRLSELLSDKELRGRLSKLLDEADELLQSGSKGMKGFEETVAELHQTISENRESIKRLTASLAQLSENLEETSKTLNWLVTEGGVAENVRVAIANLRESTENVRELTANLKEVTSSEEFKSGVKQAVVGAAEVTKAASELAKRGSEIVADIQRPVRELTNLRVQPSLAIWHLDGGRGGVGDVEALITLPHRRSFGLVGVHDFSGKGYATFQLGQFLSNSLAVRAGAYRSELGIGLDWRFKGGLLSLNAYDASHPNYNAWLRLRLLHGLYLRLGVEELRHGGKFGAGLEWRLGE
ncbi:MAG: MlaD family protein [Armatimonadota bacterium]|nr:MlaD family protein [Armatimonadota bacterium]MCX7778160.1 MlaD family protein [Armatimonadota bacterium]MDW8024514.1 MlaD family protein [Armatimonadota bacterium]